MIGASFVVADQTAVAQQPAECVFHDPPAGQHDESGGVVAAFDDGEGQGQNLVCPAHQAAGIAAVGPD